MAFNSGSTSVTGSVTTTLSSAAYVQNSATQTNIVKGNAKAGTSITAGTGLLIHTNTVGKTFYITSIVATANAATCFEIRDGTTIAGTLKGSFYVGSLGTGGTQSFSTNFSTPLALTTGLFLDLGTTTTINYLIIGFEA